MKRWLRRRAAVAVFVFALASCRRWHSRPVLWLGPAVVPCRLVLGQLHEFVPTRSRTQGHRVR